MRTVHVFFPLIFTIAFVAGCQTHSDVITEVEPTKDEDILQRSDEVWLGWNQVLVAPGKQSAWIPFSPNKVGYHQIQFLNDSSIYNAGVMESCWKYSSSSTWNCWATSDVLSKTRQQQLYSGQASVQYRFRFTAKASNTKNYNFFYQFCRDDGGWSGC